LREQRSSGAIGAVSSRARCCTSRPDYPGHFPNAEDTVRVLIAAGADVNARYSGHTARHPFTGRPAATTSASSMRCSRRAPTSRPTARSSTAAHRSPTPSPSGSGTPHADCWSAERPRICGRQRPSESSAASKELVAAPPGPTAEEITNAFWCACHGGQRQTAEYLLDEGTDINWIGHDNLTPTEAAARSDAHHLVGWLQARGARPVAEPR
jgi:uncharacterized protein